MLAVWLCSVIFLSLLFRSIFFFDYVCVLSLFTAILVQSNDWSRTKTHTFCITLLLVRLLVNRYQCHLCCEYICKLKEICTYSHETHTNTNASTMIWETDRERKRRKKEKAWDVYIHYRNANKSKSSAFVYRNHKCCFVYLESRLKIISLLKHTPNVLGKPIIYLYRSIECVSVCITLTRSVSLSVWVSVWLVDFENASTANDCI